jgi:hypothetical protein
MNQPDFAIPDLDLEAWHRLKGPRAETSNAFDQRPDDLLGLLTVVDGHEVIDAFGVEAVGLGEELDAVRFKTIEIDEPGLNMPFRNDQAELFLGLPFLKAGVFKGDIEGPNLLQPLATISAGRSPSSSVVSNGCVRTGPKLSRKNLTPWEEAR